MEADRSYAEPAITDPSRFLDEQKPLAFALHCQEVCEALGLAAACCGACHDDWDQGYDGPTEYEYLDADGKYQIWATACCAVSIAMQEAGIESSFKGN